MIEPGSSSAKGVAVAFALSVCLWLAVAMTYAFFLWS